MACFPRFFQRNKNTFAPATDSNTDTILNNNDNTVQIGRYIRREETSFFTPKTSEQLKQLQVPQLVKVAVQQQQQQQQKQQGVNHIATHNVNNNISNETNSNNTSNSISNNNNILTGELNTTTPANSSKNKKFISNKLKLANNNNNNSNNNTTTLSDGNSKLANGTQIQNKLKPVKERRATALPTDAPNHTENSLDSETAHMSESEQNRNNLDAIDSSSLKNGYISATATPTSEETVKFFLGARPAVGLGDAEDEDEISYKSEAITASDFLTNANLFYDKSKYVSSYKRQNSSNDINTPRNNTSYSSNYTNKSNSTNIRMNLHLSRASSAQTMENLNIPPPPPLPPTPLITSSPSVSVISHKSKKCSGSSYRPTSTARNGAEPDYDFLNEKTKKSNQELQSYTIAEVLNIRSDSLYTTTTIGQYNFNSNGRDSGVQVEGSNCSGSIKSHRIDGGIIFQRPNLPEKKNVEIVNVDKNEATRNLIRTAIERNDFLNNYMDKERKEMVIDAMAPMAYEKDSYIIHEEDEGSEIFVAEAGFFDVIKEAKVVGSFGPMTVFGELAILYNAKRQASIKASTNALVWKIERETFREIMKISGSKERQENLNFLRTAPFLNDLGEEVLNRIVDLLRKKFFETNCCIVREGEVGNEFFIIRGGTVTIKKKNEENVERVVDRRKRGDYFGEQALLNADRRQASVYADAPGTEVLILEREAFISYLGTIPQLHEKPVERALQNHHETQRKKSEFDNEYADVQLSQLKKVATLGAGAFGRVDLVAYGKKTFALKIIKKIDVVKQDQVEHVYNEKRVMIRCHSSPFIIELYKTFRNEKFVYFLMEACMGGDVWTVMSQRRFFDEKTARFIAGCVVEAFDFLHSNNIIYRDLKPENLMLTTDGYCKLVDFGFAKQIPANQKTNTFAGTPEYVAPEIILDRGHDRSVDYWALGILIFELLVGKTPFRGQNQIKIYQQILGGIDVISMPSKIPKSAQNLIRSLCKQLPAERLGYQRRGIQDIKKHSWFDQLDWLKLKNKQLSSPIKRPITGITDVQYFVPIGVENDKEPPDEMSGWDIDF